MIPNFRNDFLSLFLFKIVILLYVLFHFKRAVVLVVLWLFLDVMIGWIIEHG
jgi:hypothetical protein